jgi:hypothetical protein
MDNSQRGVVFIKAGKKRKAVSWRETETKAIKLRLLNTPSAEPPSDKGQQFISTPSFNERTTLEDCSGSCEVLLGKCIALDCRRSIDE